MRKTPTRLQSDNAIRALFLVGFMGSGKTSVGRVLSQRLGWRFEDLDTRIEARQGCTIPEIFRNLGEAGFRQAERSALLELLTEMETSPTVAALGGGAFVQPENLRLLEASGAHTVFLDAVAEELWQRCRSEQIERPLAQDLNQFRQLHDTRRPLYMKAGWRIETSGKDIETVANEIMVRLGLGDRWKEK